MESPRWQNVVVARGRTWAVRELVELTAAAVGGRPPSGPVALVGADGLDLVAGACWLAATHGDGIVLPRERLTASVAGRLAADGFSVVGLPAGTVEAPGAGTIEPDRIRLLTSGSTGEPKLITHHWPSLFTMQRVRSSRPVRWLLTYQPGTYAWYQLVTALLYMPEQSLVLADGTTPAELVHGAAAAGVSAISATPTFWRMAMLQAAAADVDRLRSTLRRVTLGGEVVDQAILDQLQQLFPDAERIHIYASSEAGAAIVVRDGLAGFPTAWLDDASRTPRLRVEGERLYLKSPFAAVGYEEWIDTQDVAEIRADRVHLLGRAGNAMINVGGAKAHVADIERVLLAHPYVLWCRVRGVRAPLVGQLVSAAIVPRPGRETEPLPEADLVAFCSARMAAHMVPRLWERLDHIPASANWKTEG